MFGKQGGGEWTDVAISGLGIPGIVALGDSEDGSSPVYIIGPGVEAPGRALPRLNQPQLGDEKGKKSTWRGGVIKEIPWGACSP